MKYQCLMIDDEQMIAETTSEYFNMFDIKTAFVTNYDDALSFLEVNEVSMILLDINLGSKSGFELCKKIRQKYNMPILFISARTSDDDILIALNIGGDDYIKKMTQDICDGVIDTYAELSEYEVPKRITIHDKA